MNFVKEFVIVSTMELNRRETLRFVNALTGGKSVEEMDVNQCWLWQGYTKSPNKGNPWAYPYGLFFYRGKHLNAHRVVWMLFNGPIPEGLVVRHKCDNPPCVNPNHLELGTHKDNTKDMLERRRGHWIKGKRCRTPLGEFPDKRAAAEAHGVSPNTVRVYSWRKDKPDWQWLDNTEE